MFIQLTIYAVPRPCSFCLWDWHSERVPECTLHPSRSPPRSLPYTWCVCLELLPAAPWAQRWGVENLVYSLIKPGDMCCSRTAKSEIRFTEMLTKYGNTGTATVFLGSKERVKSLPCSVCRGAACLLRVPQQNCGGMPSPVLMGTYSPL